VFSHRPTTPTGPGPRALRSGRPEHEAFAAHRFAAAVRARLSAFAGQRPTSRSAASRPAASRGTAVLRLLRGCLRAAEPGEGCHLGRWVHRAGARRRELHRFRTQPRGQRGLSGARTCFFYRPPSNDCPERLPGRLCILKGTAPRPAGQLTARVTPGGLVAEPIVTWSGTAGPAVASSGTTALI
jgi:hypothetical protein